MTHCVYKYVSAKTDLVDPNRESNSCWISSYQMKHQQRRVQKRARTHSALKAHFLVNAPNYIVGCIIQKRLCQGFLKKFIFHVEKLFPLYHFFKSIGFIFFKQSMRFFPNLTFFRFSSTLLQNFFLLATLDLGCLLWFQKKNDKVVHYYIQCIPYGITIHKKTLCSTQKSPET